MKNAVAVEKDAGVDGLDSVAFQIRRAIDAIALAGSLAHPDPDAAWTNAMVAKEHLGEALSTLEAFRARSVERLVPKLGLASPLQKCDL